MSAVKESLLSEWERLKVLEAAIEEGPWRVVHGRMDDWMQVPLEARSVHGQVFGCWGRDAAETTRTSCATSNSVSSSTAGERKS